MPKPYTLPFIVAVVIAVTMLPLLQPTALAAQTSYASEILQYVREDKVYLLEKIQPRITKPSEKMVVQALLTEDAPEAAQLYRKQLADYPDPAINPVSTARLAAYEKAVATEPGLPVMLARSSSTPPLPPAAAISQPSKAATRPDSSLATLPKAPAATPGAKKADSTLQAPSKPVPAVAAGNFTLQFGSFDNITNAEQLRAQVSASTPASVQLINGVYKVRLKRSFATRMEASAFARTLPVESFIISLQP